MSVEDQVYIVRLEFTNNPDGFWTIKSSNLPGFYMAGKNLNFLAQDIPNVIKKLFKLNFNLNAVPRPLIDPLAIKSKAPDQSIETPNREWMVNPCEAVHA